MVFLDTKAGGRRAGRQVVDREGCTNRRTPRLSAIAAVVEQS